MRLADLDTPALLVDLDRLDRNVESMASRMRDAGVHLRPHIKTSKLVEVIRRQLTAGAYGFTCATVAELSVLLDEGIEHIMWAYQPVGLPKVSAAIEANRRSEVLVALDDVEAARWLGQAAFESDVEVPFVLEVDTGLARSGVNPRDAVARTVALADVEGLRFAGVMTHEGHVLFEPDREAVTRAARVAGAAVASAAAALAGCGIPCPIVSVGSTPGASGAPLVAGVTEARPGSYVFYDANQVAAGSAAWDECAATVLARVISRPSFDKATVDAGLKALSSDRALRDTGFGHIIGIDAALTVAYEEHGVLTGPGAASLKVGTFVRIIPNHVCGTVNMWSRAVAVRGDDVVEEWSIVGRH